MNAVVRRVRIPLFVLALVGGPGRVTADIALYHGSEAESLSSHVIHVEGAGSCAGHGHHCDLGVSMTGPRLHSTRRPAPALAELPRRTFSFVRGRTLGEDPSTLLPRTRAPPRLG